MNIPTVTLNNGQTIPQIGLGLWKVKNQEQFNTGFNAGINAGYRHFDTAQVYENEQYLGEIWKQCGITREELFITTKIWLKNFGNRHLQASFDESLKKLQTTYVDLLLLHFPVTVLRKNAWKSLEALVATDKVKSIGVSNYTITHLEDMKKYAKITPVINQVELHVFLQQPELIKYCQSNGIAIEAYSPLAHAKEMDNPIITKIADKHGKSYAQVMLRWLLQQDLIILPKSVTPKRIDENMAVFDFKLDAGDLAELKNLDKDMRTCWSPVHVP